MLVRLRVGIFRNDLTAATMERYELSQVQRSGRRRQLAALTCRSDDEAIARALLVQLHQVVELRRGDVLVWRFER